MVSYNRIHFGGIPIWGVFWLIFTFMCITPTATFSAKTIPDQTVLAEIVEENMLDFALAVKAEDFTVFYRRISKLWQDQTTKEQLLNLFKSFSDKKIDLILLEGKIPDFYKKPLIDDNGWLVLQGKYGAFPYYVDFILRYTFENNAWKLAGIDYESIAEIWKNQSSKDEFVKIFKSFMDKNIDLTGVRALKPVFEKPPYLDSNGLLRIKGFYATEPSKTALTLKYFSEKAAWKLVGINIKMK